jgi:hypothetical protein
MPWLSITFKYYVMLSYGMECETCHNQVMQSLLANIYDAVHKYHEILIQAGIMHIKMDTDEFYDGNHGIYIYFMGKVFYIQVLELKT